MENGMMKADLLRLIGQMGIFVGIAWALQILVIGHDGATLERLLWVLAAAAICGAGAGLVVTSKSALNESMSPIGV